MNPYPTTAPRPLQPTTESLIKILTLLHSAIGPNGLKIYLPNGIEWGTIVGDIQDQTDLIDLITQMIEDGVIWGNITGTIGDQVDLTTYINDAIALAVSTSFDIKGGIDCSTNPDYPAAVKGDVYLVTVGGKIGGALGEDVEPGDIMTCFAAVSPAGDQATVGGNWSIQQNNIPALTTVGMSFATAPNPAVASYPRVKPDGTLEYVVPVTPGGNLLDIQDVWASIPNM